MTHPTDYVNGFYGPKPPRPTEDDYFEARLQGVPVEGPNPWHRPPSSDESRRTFTLYVSDDEGTNIVPEEIASVIAPNGFTMWHTWGAWDGEIEAGWAIEIQGDWDLHVAPILSHLADVTNEEFVHVRMGNVGVRYVNLDAWRL